MYTTKPLRKNANSCSSEPPKDQSNEFHPYFSKKYDNVCVKESIFDYGKYSIMYKGQTFC